MINNSSAQKRVASLLTLIFCPFFSSAFGRLSRESFDDLSPRASSLSHHRVKCLAKRPLKEISQRWTLERKFLGNKLQFRLRCDERLLKFLRESGPRERYQEYPQIEVLKVFLSPNHRSLKKKRSEKKKEAQESENCFFRTVK